MAVDCAGDFGLPVIGAGLLAMLAANRFRGPGTDAASRQTQFEHRRNLRNRTVAWIMAAQEWGGDGHFLTWLNAGA